MKTKILLALAILIPATATAQLQVRKMGEKAPEVKPIRQNAAEGAPAADYDARYNMRGGLYILDYFQYKGQDVCFYPVDGSVEGYTNFYDKAGARYKDDGTGKTPTDSINNRIYRIADFNRSNLPGYGLAFTLIRRDTGDTIMWHETPAVDGTARPVIMAYFGQSLSPYAGRLCKCASPRNEYYDINTSQRVKAGSRPWRCTGLAAVDIKPGYELCYIFEDEKGAEIAVPLPRMPFARLDGPKITGREKRLEELTRRYGAEVAECIIRREVRIGMTPQQCILAIGNPRSTTRTVAGDYTSEIWEYYSGLKVLFFENGRLAAIESNRWVP